MNATWIVRKVFFPIFTLVHAIAWQTCKSHDNEGMCVELFGKISSASSPDDNLVRSAAQRRFWKRLFFGRRSVHAKRLQQQLLEEHEDKQRTRLDLVRELNLALAVLCGMAIFVSTESIRTQLLFVETVVFGCGAWDAIRTADMYSTPVGTSAFYLTLVLLLLALIATIGLFLQVSPDVVTSPRQGDERSLFHRTQFDVLPDDVQELMQESVEAVVVSPSDDSTRWHLFPGEAEAGILTVSITKPSHDAIVGITLKKVEESCRIVVCHLSRTGLLASTPLQVGHTILAINGIPITEDTTAREAIAIIKRSEKHVSILATTSILLKVTKPTPSAKYGFSFCRMGKTDQLIIHKIHSGSLLAETAVQEGMRVLAINQRVCPATLSEAVEWLRTTNDLTLIVLPMVNQTSSPPFPHPSPMMQSP